MLILTTALYIFSLIITLGYTTLLFFIAQFKKDNSIIDIAYGLGFIIVSIILMNKFSPFPITLYSYSIFLLITLWGTRLATRIYNKNKGKPEDFRYATWRTTWMRKGYIYYLARTYLQIFILQGLIISIVLLPFTLSLSARGSGTHTFLVGLVVWVIGFFFEATGDKQLDRFIKSKSTHKGTIMKTGLWKYTRHPNYFGESTMWFGLSFIALASGASYAVLLSPFLITYLLLYVSGIPMLEKKWEGNSEWEEYKKKTSAFIPLPPKK